MSKIKLQDFIYFGRLFEIYKNMLNEDRQKIMESYFEYNMTLAEIAEEKKITRQAVLDSIDKSCEKLREFENKLCLLKKKENLTNLLDELAEENPLLKEKLENIKKEI